MPQLPAALHVWTPLPEHWVLPGAQTPVHPPATQAWLPQSIGAPQAPVPSQTSTAFPAHWVAPAMQGPAASAETSLGPSSVWSSAAPTVVSAPPPSDPSSPERVLSGAPSAAPSSPMPPLLPGLPASPPSYVTPRPVLVVAPPQAAARLAAMTPPTNNRIQRLESLMGP